MELHWIVDVVIVSSLMGLINSYAEELKVSQADRGSVPSSLQTKPESVNLSKYVLKLFLHQSGDVAAKFEYNAVGCHPFCLLFLI